MSASPASAGRQTRPSRRISAKRVERRPHLHVVVEVRVDVAAVPRPAPDPARPAREGPRRVAARVDPDVPVKAHVHEAPGGVEHHGPLARGVRDHDGDAVPRRQRAELVVHEARVPHLDRVAHGPVGVDGEPRATRHARVPPAGERQGLPRSSAGGARRTPRGAPARRRASAGAARGTGPASRAGPGPRGEEVGEGPLDVPEPQEMRDVAGALHREDEARRRRAVPRRVVLGPLERVERAVDLHGREVPSAELELAPLGQPSGYQTPRQGG